jgi:hypothetical protein
VSLRNIWRRDQGKIEIGVALKSILEQIKITLSEDGSSWRTISRRVKMFWK